MTRLFDFTFGSMIPFGLLSLFFLIIFLPGRIVSRVDRNSARNVEEWLGSVERAVGLICSVYRFRYSYFQFTDNCRGYYVINRIVRVLRR